jgi:xanthine dehydrogenase YagR molybdenum-binding subunit
MARTEKLLVGVGKNLSEVPVEVPDNTPRPWDGNSKLKIIGGRQSRIDGHLRSTGKAKYTFDIQLSGMLYGKILRSPHPAARVLRIDTSRAEKLPGVRSVIRIQDQLPFTARYAGQEIAAVAATTAAIAEKAIKLIDVEYETLPFVTTSEQAMKANAPEVYLENISEKKTEGDLPGATAKVEKKGNVRGPNISNVGGSREEIEKALEACPVKVHQVYRTQVQTHAPMETHGVVVRWESADKVTVWASTQGVFSVRNDVADYFDLPKTNVRVITDFMGGGFGAKFGAGVYGITAARLAKKANAPVRLMLNRKEEHLSAGNRPDSVQEISIGAEKSGKIKVIKTIAYGTAGIGTGAGSTRPAMNLYEYEKFYSEESDVFINAGPGAAFRAPGHPQGVFALEQAIDELAYQLNMDPIEVRRMNTLQDPVRQEEYRIGAEKSGWAKRNPKATVSTGPVKKGIGMANSVWYYIYGTGFPVTIEVYADGSVRLINGVQDIGGGIGTVLAMVAAEELGLKVKDIAVKIGDTEFGLSPGSGGSQTTAGVTPAARDAAYLAKMKMFKIAAMALSAEVADLEAADGRIFVRNEPARSLTWKQVAAKIPGGQFSVVAERKEDYRNIRRQRLDGVQFAEVEVDTGTGVVKVKRVVAVHDCGRPMDRLTIESQIQGGIIQGISYALFEDRKLDDNTGHMVNANLEQYKIAGALDVPVIESEIIDAHFGQNSTGAMGIGEPATIPTAAAIANAVYHAIGVRIRELPITPDKVLAALNKVPRGKQ